MKISPKGFVEPTEMDMLCNKIRILLENRNNVTTESEWLTLRGYTNLMRCFTICERDHIESSYELFLWWKRKRLKAKYE